MASYAITVPLGKALGMSEPSARVFLSLFLVYPFSIVHRLVIAKQNAQAQHLYSAISGIWLVYFVVGTNIWHCFFDVLLVYTVLKMFGGTKMSVFVVWITTLSHLLFGYLMSVLFRNSYEVTWTLPLCVMTLKLIGLTTDLYDGHQDQNELSEDQKTNAVSSVPPLLEILGYCFFFGGVLVGPQVLFTRFRKFTSGKLFPLDSTPSCVPASLLRLATGLFFAALYAGLSSKFPVSNIKLDSFAEKGLLEKLALTFITAKIALWRYVTVWLIAEGACIMTGVSFKSVRQDGTVDWSAVRNLDVWKFEWTITLQGVIESFNIGTNYWVLLYVYKRLKWLGNKSISQALTLIFLTVWHGLWPGYLLNFSFEYFAARAEKEFISTCKAMLGCSLHDFSWPIRLPLWVAAYTLKNIILFYPFMLFVLLNWRDCYKFMAAVYFYGYFVVGVWLVCYAGYKMSCAKSRKHKQL